MKRAVSISIGSSKRDRAVEITLLGQRVSIERIGTDGDMEAAALKYKELDGIVDAFGVGGADLGVMVEGVPFTDNQAERELRPDKVKHKVSNCFRTDQGAKVYALLQAVISTCRKQERNVFATLRALFAHQPVSLIAGT